MGFFLTASATAYGFEPKFVMAEHSATAKGENWAYGPTLDTVEHLHGFQKIDSTYLYLCQTYNSNPE